MMFPFGLKGISRSKTGYARVIDDEGEKALTLDIAGLVTRKYKKRATD
jgi:hypothetical protein